ncbi:TIGR02391 family protein [Xenococcus sp. PCC 7305]|uniref:TIGR02391 family protein n=1 Tax=Xenococcus sp. PCC 7305 TaxID=102125 RepID=UPI0002AD0CFD|nr:TIGR02391 family protein [Xenococcus sp. PCC 7305]ELS05429.1 TIGR02391 family protein [Xenococcus sp. PCC 7305]
MIEVKYSYPEDSHNKNELSNSHIHDCFFLNVKPLNFFLKSLKFYLSLLKQNIEKIEQDEYLNDILTDDIEAELVLTKDVYKTELFIDSLENKLNEEKRFPGYHISISHGDIRYLKSVCLLYIQFLYSRRNKLSAQINISINILKVVDTQITKLEEILKSGIFISASTVPLLVDQVVENEYIEKTELEEEAIPNAKRPRPVFINSIEILDSELRTRCLDLFNHFEEREQPERHDTVVMEATKILENRLRDLTKSTGSETGAKLVNIAFSEKDPKLIISDIPAEQKAVFFLFQGAFGYIRNIVHHRLLGDLSPERALQILGFIDYLIYLLNLAKYNEE